MTPAPVCDKVLTTRKNGVKGRRKNLPVIDSSGKTPPLQGIVSVINKDEKTKRRKI